MGLLNRLDKVDNWVIYVLLLVVMSVTLIRPVGLAITPSEGTRNVYQAIESLPSGSIVWLGMDYAPSASAELMAGQVALLRHGLEKGLRFVAGGTLQVMAGNIAQELWETVSSQLPDKAYGVDFVNVGYKPGGNVFLEKMMEDAHQALMNVDNFGTTLSTLPLMSEFESLKDCDLVCSFISAKGIQDYIAHVTDPEKIPLVVGAVAVQISEMMPYVASGQITGILKGMRGSAEYEVVTDKPGPAVAGMDTQSFSHLLLIFFIVLGNIGYSVSRKNDKHTAGSGKAGR